MSAVHTPLAFLSGTLWSALDHFGTLVLLYAVTVRREDAEAVEARHRGVREAHRAADRTARGDLASGEREKPRRLYAAVPRSRR